MLVHTGEPGDLLVVPPAAPAEHSDEEWYPPTPPHYDVTHKLQEVNAAAVRENASTEHTQSAVRWKEDIVQVQYIELLDTAARARPANIRPELFLKTNTPADIDEAVRKEVTERICEIEELSLAEKSHKERTPTSNRQLNNNQEEPKVFIDNDNENLTILNNPQFHSKLWNCDFHRISPVIEENSRASKCTSEDTASEVSDIPTDDEREEKEKNEFLQDKNDSKKEEKDKRFSESNVGHQSKNFPSCDEDSQYSYSSDTSSYSSSINTNSSSSDTKVRVPDKVLNKLTGEESSEDSKPIQEEKLQGQSDMKNIEVEIKEEFERNNQSIKTSSSRNFIKKSPEDSGFESFQQSSVEQNSNQDSDEEDVIQTFATVVEVEGESSLSSTSEPADPASQDLFAQAETARLTAQRLRQESAKVLARCFNILVSAKNISFVFVFNQELEKHLSHVPSISSWRPSSQYQTRQRKTSENVSKVMSNPPVSKTNQSNKLLFEHI